MWAMEVRVRMGNVGEGVDGGDSTEESRNSLEGVHMSLRICVFQGMGIEIVVSRAANEANNDR